jgi:hypothetical protein
VPAKDHYHQTVIDALKNDGWIILADQVKIEVGRRRLWIDLHAQHLERNETILIEVKGFENSPSDIEALAHAVGQYLLYRTVLSMINSSLSIFLAVPGDAYEGILSESIGQQVIKQLGIKLLVFNPLQEEITLWLP